MKTPQQHQLAQTTMAVLVQKKTHALARFAHWHARWDAGDDNAEKYMDRWQRAAVAYDRQLTLMMTTGGPLPPHAMDERWDNGTKSA